MKICDLIFAICLLLNDFEWVMSTDSCQRIAFGRPIMHGVYLFHSEDDLISQVSSSLSMFLLWEMLDADATKRYPRTC